MPPYVLIPLLACIGACVISSAVIARDPMARRRQFAGAIVACAGVWALCDLLAQVLNREAIALSLARGSTLPVLAIAPLAVQLLLEQSRELRNRYARVLPPLWLGVGALMTLSVFTPAFVSGVTFTKWGWMTKLGPFYYVGFAPVVVCMVIAFASYRTHGRLKQYAASSVRHVLALMTMLMLSVISVTEVMAPLLEIAAPRLGALSVTVLGGILWVLTGSMGEYIPLPSDFSRRMLDNISDGVALVNREGRIRTVNASFARLVQSEPNKLKDVSIEERFGLPVGAIPEHGEEFETSFWCEDGTTIPVSATRSDLRNEQGTRLGAVLIVRDLGEVARLRRRLLAAGRLAAVGELAAGIVHEVNNPVSYIRSNLNSLHKNDVETMEILARELPANTVPATLNDVQHLVGQSLQSCDRVARIVKDVRGFSHMGPTGQHTTDLNNLLEEVVRIATPQLRTRATVVRKFGEIPLVECSGQEIRQVFLDLILGAAHSLEGRGTIRIETSAADDQVTIIVEDNGCGYTPTEIEAVFEPVSCRTDTEGARDHCVAYQIVRQHKGFIQMESELGEGAKVSVILPINQTNPVDLKRGKANGGSRDFDAVADA